MNFYSTLFSDELIDKLTYMGGYIPPFFRRPPPLKEVAFASAILGGFVLAIHREIKSLADYSIRTIETKDFRNKPCQIFQSTFRYLKSNPITHFFFKTVFYTPIVDLNFAFFVPAVTIGTCQIIEQRLNINTIATWNFLKSVTLITTLFSSMLINSGLMKLSR